MKTSRVEAFSDGVFPIALTVPVLTIEAPDPRGDLARELIHLWPSYLAYALTVLVIGAVWVNHHAMFEHIAVVDWPLLFMNTLTLGFVAFLPLPTKVLASALHAHHGEPAAMLFYGMPFALSGVGVVGTWSSARRRGHLKPSITDTQARAIQHRYLVGPSLYVVRHSSG
jgi:uncharacterized membrane protein